MLDEKKEKAITYLLKGEGPTEVAKIVGVVRATIYNWLNMEDFKAELDERRREIVSQGNRYVVGNLIHNLDIVQKIADDKCALPHDRLGAGTYLIDRVLGKTTTKIENKDSNGDKNKVDEDMLNDVFSEVDEGKKEET